MVSSKNFKYKKWAEKINPPQHLTKNLLFTYLKHSIPPKKDRQMPVLSMLTLFDTLILLYLFQLCKYHIVYYLDVGTLHAG